MTTDVTQRDSNLPAFAGSDEAGMSGELGRDDITTPTCSIVQPSSGSERGNAGTFWFSDGTNLPKLEVVVLEIAGTRTLWAPKGEGDSGPICRSPNRREGLTEDPDLVLRDLTAERKADLAIAGGDGPAYIPCDVCPHYKDDPFARGDYLCKPGYTLLLHEVDQGPFLFFVKGSAMGIIKRKIVSPALIRMQQGQPAAPWRNMWDWSLELKEGKQGKYYVPAITSIGVVEDPETYERMSAELRGEAGKAVHNVEQESDEATSQDAEAAMAHASEQ